METKAPPLDLTLFRKYVARGRSSGDTPLWFDLEALLAEVERTRADLAAASQSLSDQIEHTKRFDVLVVAVDHFLNIDSDSNSCPFHCDYDPDSVTPAQGHEDYCPIRKLSDAFLAIPESYLATAPKEAE